MADAPQGNKLALVGAAGVSLIVTAAIVTVSYLIRQHLAWDWRLLSLIVSISAVGVALVVLVVMVLVRHGRRHPGVVAFMAEPVEKIQSSPWHLALGVFCVYQGTAALILAVLPAVWR